MPLDAAIRQKLAAGALKAAAEGGLWRGLTIFDLADAAGLDVADLVGATPGDAIDAVEESFDRAMARGLRSVDREALVRDRLFDVLMRRFEAMEASRAGVLAIDGATESDPAALALQHARHVRAARFALALAGLEADGVAAAARAQGLALIITQARAAWRSDTGGDFAKTMSTLDKALRQAEQTFGKLAGFGEARPAAGKPASEPPAHGVAGEPPPIAG